MNETVKVKHEGESIWLTIEFTAVDPDNGWTYSDETTAKLTPDQAFDLSHQLRSLFVEAEVHKARCELRKMIDDIIPTLVSRPPSDDLRRLT